MLTTASCWRECTRCFCFASPSNFAFTWATGITIHINSCPVKCSRNVDESGHFVDGRQPDLTGLCKGCPSTALDQRQGASPDGGSSSGYCPFEERAPDLDRQTCTDSTRRPRLSL